MKKPDLSRYEADRLEAMLHSYRTLSREHLDRGHFALAKWATRMVTYISIEMNEREMREEAAKKAQMSFYDYELPSP